MRALWVIGFAVFAAFVPLVGSANAPIATLQPEARAGVEDTVIAPVPVRTAERTRRRFLEFLRPNSRPESRRLSRKERRALAKGGLCGDVAIQGEAVGRVPGKLTGCGIEDAVRVRAISGVALSQQAVMDCTTAKALKTWIETGMRPAVKQRGGGVVSLRVAAHYSCRTRNNIPGAKISEHGRGKAIDISGFTLKDGSTITVLGGWGQGRDGKILRRMHAAACGPFGTVLGPKADRYHRDHFHFDTAQHRGGSYCQ